MKMKLAISHGRMMCRKNMKMEINKMKNNFLIWTQSEAVGWTLTGGHWGGGRSTSLQNNIKHYKSIHSVVSIMLVFVSLGMCFFLYFFLRCLHDACSTLKFESLIWSTVKQEKKTTKQRSRETETEIESQKGEKKRLHMNYPRLIKRGNGKFLIYNWFSHSNLHWWIFPWFSHDFPIQSSRKILDFPAIRASSVTAPSARCSPTNCHARSYPPPPWCDARDCCTSTAPWKNRDISQGTKRMGLKDWYHNGRYIVWEYDMRPTWTKNVMFEFCMCLKNPQSEYFNEGNDEQLLDFTVYVIPCSDQPTL